MKNAKKFLIVIPTRKEPYIKGFVGHDGLYALLDEKVGRSIQEVSIRYSDIPAVILAGTGIKKSNERLNKIASSLAEKELYGTVIMFAADEFSSKCGYEHKEAADIINRLKGASEDDDE